MRSPPTVKTHVSSILRKLDVDDRTQAAVEAVRLGLGWYVGPTGAGIVGVRRP